MNEKLFTLPLDPQWRETIKENLRWGEWERFKVADHSIAPILAHETTEKALTRLVRASKNGLPASYFCTVLSRCLIYARFEDMPGPDTPPWMVNRKEFQRMAEAGITSFRIAELTPPKLVQLPIISF